MTTTTETMTNIYENWEFIYNTHDMKKENIHMVIIYTLEDLKPHP